MGAGQQVAHDPDCQLQFPGQTNFTTTTPKQSHQARPKPAMTPCSKAYKLILQHNKRGLDMFQIGIWLWNGFHPGEKDSHDCLVDSDLVSGLLDFICDLHCTDTL